MSPMSEKEEPTSTPESANFKINFRIPGRMPSVYAHHMLIQPGEQEVLISFFELIPPVMLGDNEAQLKLLQETGIAAECVSRITVAKSRFQGFAAAMQQIASLISSEVSEEKGQENADTSGDSPENQ